MESLLFDINLMLFVTPAVSNVPIVSLSHCSLFVQSYYLSTIFTGLEKPKMMMMIYFRLLDSCELIFLETPFSLISPLYFVTVLVLELSYFYIFCA